MQEILDQYVAYMLSSKSVSIKTCVAYKKDIADFIHFIIRQGRTIIDIKPKDFFDFFDLLMKKQVSLSTGVRKSAALKSFARYLHHCYHIPNYGCNIVPSMSFPIMCDMEKVTKLLKAYSTPPHTYKRLRTYIMLSLLTSCKIGIKNLIVLRMYNICYETLTIRLPNREVELPSKFFDLLKCYVSQIPYQSIYLFPVKLGGGIKPISGQAVWSILRSLLTDLKPLSLVDSPAQASSDQLEIEVHTIYKNKHPRS
jgi:site-specific recombinase XerD